MSRWARAWAAALCMAAAVTTLSGPAHAAPGQVEVSVTLTGPTSGVAGTTVELRATLAETTTGAPVPGAEVQLMRVVGDDTVADEPAGAVVRTSDDGTATLPAPLEATSPNRFYLTYPGDGIHAAGTSAQHIVTVTPPAPALTRTTLSGPSSARIGHKVTVTAVVTAAGSAVVGQLVTFEVRRSGSWKPVGTVRTDARGYAPRAVSVRAGTNVFRARFTGPGYVASTSNLMKVTGLPNSSVLTLTGPRRIVDEHTVKLRATWTAAGRPVVGTLTLRTQVGAGRWHTVAHARTNRHGVATFTLTPRRTTRFQVKAPAGSWYSSARSPVRTVKNVPPLRPLVLPAAAPKPRGTLPAQPRATGRGAHPMISTLSSTTWSTMVGRTWHPGCPVGRADLRLIRVNYWGFDGYRHRGELVTHRSVAGRAAAAFADLYTARVRIRSMYRVDVFGWSDRVHGADDYASMLADNTSGFNCREVVGRPGVLSPHATGRAIDINTFENPYHTVSDGWVPNSWWVTRRLGSATWRSPRDTVVRILARHAIRWTYGMRDAQHFDA